MPALFEPSTRQNPERVAQASPRVAAATRSSNGLTCVMDYRLSEFCWKRLQAASQLGPVLGLEMSAQTREYRWDKVEARGDFQRVTLFPEGEAGDAPTPEMIRRLHTALDQYRPATVAVVGWSFNWSLAALAWCLKNEVPAILLSDSTANSNSRIWYKEMIKRRLVRLYSTAVVAGNPQRDYVASLGVPSERIFRAWDVVDNAYFVARSDAARSTAAELRSRFSLPERYFVSVSRFVEMKNVLRLVQAYAAYRAAAGAEAWKFVLIGDGPMKPEVLRLRDELGLGSDLILPGWKQYPELPVYYGLAGAFVLASTREPWGLVVNEAMASGLPVLVSELCGCAQDLVAPGENGFRFDPYDVPKLAEVMSKMASRETDRERMAATSRRIIANWTPEIWADNLRQASRMALALPRPRLSLIDRLLLKSLIR